MIRKIYASLKTRGIVDLCGAGVRAVFPFRAQSYRRGIPLLRDRIGLEIGGPSSLFKPAGAFPVYALAARIDNCNFGHRTIWEGSIDEGKTFRFDKRRAPGKQYVAEATDLSRIASASYDFVLSSHTLEHVANPLRALSEWVRVLKDDGLLVLVVPHKDGTFDHRRPVTALAHLIADRDGRVTEDDLTHLEEILALHDLARDPGAGDLESFTRRSQKNAENRALHHHVFDTRLAIEVVHHMGLQILSVEAFHPYHIVIVARKAVAGKPAQNEQFRGEHAAPVWKSPFPSDQAARRSGG